MLVACNNYYKVTTSMDPPADVIKTQQDESKFIILHSGDRAWWFVDIHVIDTIVTGQLLTLQGHNYYVTTNPARANQYKTSKSIEKDESEVLNEVHITASEFTELDSNKIAISLNQIEKIEIYDKDVGSTTASWIFGGLGVGLGVLAIITVIAALTKSCCPFIYANTGSNYEFCGEIYSGAIQPPLERHDYLPLYELKEVENRYKVQMKNEVHEIQHTNLSEMFVVDHAPGTRVLIDKYGKLLLFKDMTSPLSASNLEGNDILPQLLSRDSLSYSGPELGKDPNLTDGAILEFEIPEGSDSINLRLRAKNSFWVDYLFTRFHRLFGSSYDSYMKKQAENSKQELMDQMFDQKLPISVFIEKNGKWEYQDFFNIAGPMALRDDILSLDVSNISSSLLRVKLEYGLYFWNLDYVGISSNCDEKFRKHLVPLESAIDGNMVDVKDLLVADDSLYYIQPDIGDVVEMTFKVPESYGMERSLFLHSKGHYRILREQSGSPDIETLRSLNTENGLPRYSIELIKELFPPSEN